LHHRLDSRDETSSIVAPCADDLGEWCRWGATTQDITDTATVLQIRESLALIEQELAAILQSMAALAKKYRVTPVAGRSNLPARPACSPRSRNARSRRRKA
jgi:adenylosuccinate lyase